MKRILVVAAAALALAGCDAAVLSGSDGNDDTLDIPEIADGDISEKTMVDVTRELSSDEFEGRMPGSEGEKKTVELLTQRFEAAGLQPGNDGKWTQDVPLVEITGSDFAPLSITGGKDGGMAFEYGKDWVGVSYRETPRTRINNSELVFVGYGINAPERGWNDYEGLDMKGKTAVILVNDPDFGAEDLEGPFNGKAMTYYGRWTYKFEEAARQGATAAIIIHETEPASYGWDVVSNSWSGAQSDLVRSDGGADRAMLEGWITRDTAEELFASAGLDLEALKQQAKSNSFTPVPLEGVKASGKISQSIDQLESRNVVGKLTGKVTPDEYVLYTAHWDHLGKKSEEKTGAPGEDFYQDQIFNGAVDNATGSAALLEIAEAMAADDLERSALFLSVTLEESGLLGSAFYAENPLIPHSQVVAGINMDGALPIGRTKDMVVVGYGASELEDILRDVLVEQDRVIKPDSKPEAGYFYRSDHISLAKKGVPMLYADGGQDKLDGGVAAGKAAAAVYTAERYHKPMDEYSDGWDLSGFEEDIQALYQVGLRIAQSDDWPTWYEGNEFEAIRKQSLEE